MKVERNAVLYQAAEAESSLREKWLELAESKEQAHRGVAQLEGFAGRLTQEKEQLEHALDLASEEVEDLDHRLFLKDTALEGKTGDLAHSMNVISGQDTQITVLQQEMGAGQEKLAEKRCSHRKKGKLCCHHHKESKKHQAAVKGL
jgi:chromosome segregation ATPase